MDNRCAQCHTDLEVEEQVVGDGNTVGLRDLLGESPRNHRVVGEIRIEKTIGNDVAKAQTPKAWLIAEHVHIRVEGVIPRRPGDIGGSVGTFGHHFEIALHVALGQRLQKGVNVREIAIEHPHRGA